MSLSIRKGSKGERQVKFVLAILVSLSTFLSSATDIADVTYKLIAQRVVDGNAYTGYGSCVAVDLSKYGYNGTYIMTANHCTEYTENGAQAKYPKIYAEINKNRVPAVLVKYDLEFDLAILKLDIALPEVAEIAPKYELKPNDALEVCGFTFGKAKVKEAVKFKSKSFDTNIPWIMFSKTFDHGNSGGPVFYNGKLYGIGIGLVAFDVQGEKIRVSTEAFFVPYKRIIQFLSYND